MADDRASHSEEHKDDGVISESTILADTKNAFEHDSLDLLYATEAEILNDALQEIGMGKYQTRKLAWSTNLLVVVWGALCFFFFRVLELPSALIGLASPFSFVDGLRRRLDQVILRVIGVSGALLAVWTVQLPLLGRRGSLAIYNSNGHCTILTGVFLFASTTARSSAALLGWNCGYNFMSYIMYGVLYALSPKLFPTKDRGTGNAPVAAANRVFGIMAPIIILYANLTTSVSVYISGALFIVVGFIPVLLPLERRGKASLAVDREERCGAVRESHIGVLQIA
ncbi:hypothetical protein H4582DRAFT_2086916 [Lactarius indigo]|nr:hypothetical protein H4582DRAFT_2086916 [Lactarius indigo]